MKLWTKEDNDFLIDNFAKIFPQDAERQLNREWKTIYSHGRGLGLRRDNDVVRKLHSIANIGNGKIYSINSNYFDVLDKNNTYVFGLLATDGCMHKRKEREMYFVSLGLQNNDRYIIENINKNMNSTYKIYSIEKNMSRVVIRDQKICRRLLELGIIPKKSLVLECPDIPTDMISDFVRGVIDGDGTVQIKKPKISVYSGSVNFASGIQKLLYKIGINSKIYVNRAGKNPNYILTIGRINDILKLRALMYNTDSDLFLKRKKERLDIIYDKYKNYIWKCA